MIGVDSSFLQLKAAKDRGLNVAVMDGHQLSFRGQFDAVFSNAALHWMQRPEAVVAGVASSLKPAGRFIGEFGGKGNVAKSAPLFTRSFEGTPSTYQSIIRGTTPPQKNIQLLSKRVSRCLHRAYTPID